MDEFLTALETKAGSMIEIGAALAVGLLAAGAFWLWSENGETLVISSLIAGLPICF